MKVTQYTSSTQHWHVVTQAAQVWKSRSKQAVHKPDMLYTSSTQHGMLWSMKLHETILSADLVAQKLQWGNSGSLSKKHSPKGFHLFLNPKFLLNRLLSYIKKRFSLLQCTQFKNSDWNTHWLRVLKQLSHVSNETMLLDNLNRLRSCIIIIPSSNIFSFKH